MLLLGVVLDVKMAHKLIGDGERGGCIEYVAPPADTIESYTLHL